LGWWLARRTERRALSGVVGATGSFLLLNVKTALLALQKRTKIAATARQMAQWRVSATLATVNGSALRSSGMFAR